jgi:hypothetical protein
VTGFDGWWKSRKRKIGNGAVISPNELEEKSIKPSRQQRKRYTNFVFFSSPEDISIFTSRNEKFLELIQKP